jgi:hypothetical protein
LIPTILKPSFKTTPKLLRTQRDFPNKSTLRVMATGVEYDAKKLQLLPQFERQILSFTKQNF